MIHIQRKTGDIITIAQFKEDNSLSEYCKCKKSGDKYDDSDEDLTLPTLISEAKMDEMSPGDESDAEPMPMNMLE